MSHLLKPVKLTDALTLRNKVVMAPMTTWSADPAGNVSTQELDFYQKRSNGVGMVITGTTYVSQNGIGFENQFGGWDDKFIPSLTRLAEAAKSGGAPAILQIFHAGDKAIAELTPNEEIVSASAVQLEQTSSNGLPITTRALNDDEVWQMVKDFGQGVRRAIMAGFDGVELHGAHGFLIQNFFSPLYNQRHDYWGGSLEKRMNFPLEVVKEAKRIIAKYATKPFALGYRISLEEAESHGLRIDDSLQLIDALIAQDISYLHVSLGDLLGYKPIDKQVSTTSIELVSQHVNKRIPVIAAGSIKLPSQAEQALQLGVDFVAVGQGLVINPNWVELAQSGQSGLIEQSIDLSNTPLPDGLVHYIRSWTGWFNIKTA
ncbi:NADH-dependent flavin oxidoreductase [uncultured Shewanella sp.]|uniref:NADH-dependent flavin oxidoreductase n=1 Tax=uncultured Shewanella sp. TaxID=173975 RepID=UPI00262DA595|nr:NADH-dependent flavin oxidoreductase [uncultured Shewanella sp.]